ncbi:hypothetical protein CLV45_4309 [Hymenobacter chitinivorans DSM 11115]|uniref:Uncharacterized protein n=1 Tax=Hymenobacter chitinivorans DSM 11115 TaxID=1121954 RepID=A0A2M9ASC5_9BACT|nr:hypothetical protein CLV45_4309 [Hymenobacter chitinivorans DSM 11115]
MTLSRRVVALLTGLLLPLNSCFWGNENNEENVVGNFWIRMKADEQDYHLYYDN